MSARFWIWLLCLSRRQVEKRMGSGAWWVSADGTVYRGRDAAVAANSLALTLALREEGRLSG